MPPLSRVTDEPLMGGGGARERSTVTCLGSVLRRRKAQGHPGGLKWLQEKAGVQETSELVRRLAGET